MIRTLEQLIKSNIKYDFRTQKYKIGCGGFENL